MEKIKMIMKVSVEHNRRSRLMTALVRKKDLQGRSEMGILNAIKWVLQHDLTQGDEVNGYEVVGSVNANI